MQNLDIYTILIELFSALTILFTLKCLFDSEKTTKVLPYLKYGTVFITNNFLFQLMHKQTLRYSVGQARIHPYEQGISIPQS